MSLLKFFWRQACARWSFLLTSTMKAFASFASFFKARRGGVVIFILEKSFLILSQQREDLPRHVATQASNKHGQSAKLAEDLPQDIPNGVHAKLAALPKATHERLQHLIVRVSTKNGSRGLILKLCRDKEAMPCPHHQAHTL